MTATARAINTATETPTSVLLGLSLPVATCKLFHKLAHKTSNYNKSRSLHHPSRTESGAGDWPSHTSLSAAGLDLWTRLTTPRPCSRIRASLAGSQTVYVVIGPDVSTGAIERSRRLS